MTDIQQTEPQERRKIIFNNLKNEFDLPSPSGTVFEVIRVCNLPSSSLDDLAKTIQTDPALSVELLKYANSAFLSTGIQVASVEKATVKLGMSTVSTLALGFSLMTDNKTGKCDHFDYSHFWQSSLAQAIAARELARLNKGIEPDELFICGLLAHMGELSLATIFPEKYGELLARHQQDALPLVEQEFEIFGIDSRELTTELFMEWGLPVNYALASGFHEDLDHVELGSGTTLKSAAVLSLSQCIAQMCLSEKPRMDLIEKLVFTSEKHDIEIGVFNNTFGKIVESWHDHGQLFDIMTQECYIYDDNE